MKRYFLKSETKEEATIIQEPEAVTVTRRTIDSRSKGKPMRIPLKRCHGESVEQEARLQELKLKGEGFEFHREEGDGSNINRNEFVYLVVKAENAEEALEWITGNKLPIDVSLQALSNKTTVLRDARNGEIRVTRLKDENTVVHSASPLAAVAYILGELGLATVYYEVSASTSTPEVLTPMARAKLISKLPSGVRDYVEETGLINAPGIVRTSSVMPAVFL